MKLRYSPSPWPQRWGVLQQIAIHSDDRVLVVGESRLGQLIARVLRPTGCDLSVVARHPRQLELLAMANVASITEDAVAERQADLVVEATGSPSGLELAKHAVRPRIRFTPVWRRFFGNTVSILSARTFVGRIVPRSSGGPGSGDFCGNAFLSGSLSGSDGNDEQNRSNDLQDKGTFIHERNSLSLVNLITI